MPATGPNLPAMMPLYSIMSSKVGDTLNNPTTETKFASKATFKANTLLVGEVIMCWFRGMYEVPSLAIGPTANAKVYLGDSLLLQSGTLSVGIGTGVTYPFWGSFEAVVRSTGSTGSIYTAGDLTFQTAGGMTPATAAKGIETGLVSLNTTIDNDLTLAVITSNMNGQYFKLTSLNIFKLQPPPLSN